MMTEHMAQLQQYLYMHPRLAHYDAWEEGSELHLEERQGDHFVRLVPTERVNIWHMEMFHNEEDWEISVFTGTLEECLEHLEDSPHFVFWEH